jgi:hypothetical protein
LAYLDATARTTATADPYGMTNQEGKQRQNESNDKNMQVDDLHSHISKSRYGAPMHMGGVKRTNNGKSEIREFLPFDKLRVGMTAL